MPPHCDSLDGPVVGAARAALAAGDVDLVLPFVPAAAEDEVRSVFSSTLSVRGLGAAPAVVADRLFFETVVRLHRAGEGAPYHGLRPAGLSVGPVIPLAERAIETGSPNEVFEFLASVLRHELHERLEAVSALEAVKDRSVPDARRWVEAMLGFQVYSHRVLDALRAPAHGDSTHDAHG